MKINLDMPGCELYEFCFLDLCMIFNYSNNRSIWRNELKMQVIIQLIWQLNFFSTDHIHSSKFTQSCACSHTFTSLYGAQEENHSRHDQDEQTTIKGTHQKQLLTMSSNTNHSYAVFWSVKALRNSAKKLMGHLLEQETYGYFCYGYFCSFSEVLFWWWDNCHSQINHSSHMQLTHNEQNTNYVWHKSCGIAINIFVAVEKFTMWHTFTTSY